MPYSALLVFAVVTGAVVGFSVAGHDIEGMFIGGFAGLFGAMGMHSKRRLRSPAGMAVLAVLAALLVLALEAGYLPRGNPTDEAGFIWRDASVEARPVRTLKGVTLGTSLAEASARVGAFEVDAAAPPKEGARNYVQRGGRIRLLVVGERITRVSYECAMNDEDTRLNRVKCHTYDTRIVEVFGQGFRRLCGKGAPSAFAYDVLDTGTRYVVLDGFVRGFIVMEPEDLDAALESDPVWQRCS